MSLQGTLDTFALPDVLRLLASTRKSGHLRLEGSRGTGGVWLAEGSLVAVAPLAAAASEPVAPSAEALCDVLRAPDGAFVFEAGAPSPVDAEPVELAPVLVGAEELLVEWRTLAEVLPSLECPLSLRDELDGASVEVTGAQWRLVVAIGSGRSAAALGSALALGELAVTRAVKDLVEAGLVVVGQGPAATVADEEVLAADVVEPHTEVEEAPVTEVEEAPVAEVVDISGPEDEDVDDVAAAADAEAVEPAPAVAEPGPDGFVRRPLGARPGGPRGPGLGMPLSASLGELASLSPSKRPFPGAAPSVAPPAPLQDEDAAEVARRLADLGPEAVAAVTAAAEASTPEERAAALDAIEAQAEGQPVNRSALLKFLSSVRS